MRDSTFKTGRNRLIALVLGEKMAILCAAPMAGALRKV
jgi:hypothetical protein